jgi:hypothetical protein
MNTPTEFDVQELFRLVGKSVWMLQHLENAVASFTAMIILQKERDKSKKITEEYAHNVLKKQKDLTLGRMIANAKSARSIPPELNNRFDIFLIERNWLIHNCIKTDYLSLRSDKKKALLFERIHDFAEEAMVLAKEIHNLHTEWFLDYGYDYNLVLQNAEKLIQEASES